MVTPGAAAGYQVIDGLGQAHLYPPFWVAYLGNHYRSLETVLHEASEDAPTNASEATLSADSEATLSAESAEETISAEEDVTMRELEQERENLQVQVRTKL